jgi:hypothetical protein
MNQYILNHPFSFSFFMGNVNFGIFVFYLLYLYIGWLFLYIGSVLNNLLYTLTPPLFHWSACTRTGKWVVMYICVIGIEFDSVVFVYRFRFEQLTLYFDTLPLIKRIYPLNVLFLNWPVSTVSQMKLNEIF